VISQFQSLWHSRHLVWALAYYQIKAAQKTKALGILWNFLDPLLYMLTYTVLVVFIFKRGEPQFPVLLFSVIIAWGWFSAAISRSVSALTANTNIILNTRFPLIVFPASFVLGDSIEYIFGLAVLFPLLFFFDATPTPYMLLLPIPILFQVLFTFGACLICAVVGTYLKDLKNILEFGIRLWWYLSPALYTLEGALHGSLKFLYNMNPFAWLFEAYKSILVRGQMPSWTFMWATALFAILAMLIGLWLFTKQERNLAKAL
jgi:ABC-type polysaccharide/polyol phosphate export permease